MSRLLVVALCALALVGCENNMSRARDYKICRDAGMSTKITGVDDKVVCIPPANINPACDCEEAVRAALAEIEVNNE